MKNEKSTPLDRIPYDETKIYTPRSFQMQHADGVMNIYDHAPIRIYEKPIKRTTDIPESFNPG